MNTVLIIEIILPGGPIEFDWKDCGKFGDFCFECARLDFEFFKAHYLGKSYVIPGTLSIIGGQFLACIPGEKPKEFSIDVDTGKLSEVLSFHYLDTKIFHINLKAGA